MSTNTDMVLYHNPNCSKSREALTFLRDLGLQPTVVEYLKNPPSRSALQALAAKMGGVRALLRSKADVYAELGLADAKWTDEELLGFMEQHPVLLERPLLDTLKGARIGRPGAEVLREIL
ncbi:MAG: arsenate reductase (glutaredoxin) [Cellvibrionales bacterium]|nr:MAG: arsenate reductase (glutaredoxin) [Cellvibrionales bacterium]